MISPAFTRIIQTINKNIESWCIMLFSCIIFALYGFFVVYFSFQASPRTESVYNIRFSPLPENDVLSALAKSTSDVNGQLLLIQENKHNILHWFTTHSALWEKREKALKMTITPVLLAISLSTTFSFSDSIHRIPLLCYFIAFCCSIFYCNKRFRAVDRNAPSPTPAPLFHSASIDEISNYLQQEFLRLLDCVPHNIRVIDDMLTQSRRYLIISAILIAVFSAILLK